MPNIIISLTDTQYACLEYAAISPQDWGENAVTERARISSEEIVQITVQNCLANGIQVPATREDILAYAFANGVVKTAAMRQAQEEEKISAMETGA